MTKTPIHKAILGILFILLVGPIILAMCALDDLRKK